jgi:CubicO group peptidase (beta-lactamase class C family)
MNEKSPAVKSDSRIWKAAAASLLVLSGLVLLVLVKTNPTKMWKIYTFFDEDKRIENFRHLERIMPANKISRSGPKHKFTRNIRELNTTYEFRGETRSVDEFLDRTVTTGFLVVKDDMIVTEKYFLGATEETMFTSMSVAKSFVSALVGIAIDEGFIKTVDDSISDYVTALRGSGYDGVPIKHVLQMSSGVKFDEVYDDLFSDINLLFYKVFGLGQPMNDYMAGLGPESPSGETSYYRSCDTQALGMLISAVTGKSVSEYLEEKIWSKIGMEYDAFWSTDDHGTELAFGFLNAALRDYAKFGVLYLHGGSYNGEQIVSEEWVRESVTPDNPNLQPGEKPEGYETFGNFGYQYQWWIPDNPDGEYLAIGVWGQYIYVYPKENLVIVKTSVDPDFEENNYEHDDETVAVCRSIAAFLDENQVANELERRKPPPPTKESE